MCQDKATTFGSGEAKESLGESWEERGPGTSWGRGVDKGRSGISCSLLVPLVWQSVNYLAISSSLLDIVINSWIRRIKSNQNKQTNKITAALTRKQGA